MSETFTTQTYFTRVTILGCGITVIACCGVELVAHCTDMARLLTFTGSMALSWGITEWIASQDGKGLLALLEKNNASDEYGWNDDDDEMNVRFDIKQDVIQENHALVQNFERERGRKRSRSDEGRGRSSPSVHEVGKRTRTPTKPRVKSG